ncbi:MAG: hypothetical protein QNJ98_14880 [Planctomycetota bacterium]|nr:hypothetical protein [Planctomycetota bacterium]
MADTSWQSIKRWAAFGLLALTAISVGLSALNADAITSVTVQVLDADKEVRDLPLPGMHKEQPLPDYRLELVRGSASDVTLATFMDRSAAEPLEWRLPEPLPLRHVTSLRLVEDDAFRNDVIEEVQVEGERFESAKYRYTVDVAWDLGAALDYFSTTPIGMVLLLALGLAVLFVILGNVMV